MYGDHDRPSTRKIVVTAVAVVAAIAAVIGLAAAGFGMAASRMAAAAKSEQQASASVQAPATATAEVPAADPAPSARTATSAVAGSAIAPKPATTAKPAVAAPKPATTVDGSGLGVVVIDAGHEGSPPGGVEPIGPGSSTMKVKLESGTSGVATHVDESQRNLEVALRLQKALEARGVKVVMVRTSQNVKISNRQRAETANKAHAALFIRLHCDGGPTDITGILTLRPARNWYKDHPIVAQSAVAAKLVHSATLAATGAKDRGITPRNDLTGFNWSEVPSVLVEMGMMSNRGEDRRLGTAAYQDKLAEGMANGIVEYLKTR